MILFQNNKLFQEYKYSLENELENEVVKHALHLFGEKTLYINAKKKIEGKSLGNTIPDGFLFDFSDVESPAFYLVEVELAKHDFYRHIFPQVTKFISFFKNSKSQSELIEKIHELVTEDSVLNAAFLDLSKNKQPYKTIKDIVEDSQNILIVLDEDKTELKEIMDVYVDTWGKMVKTLIFKKFISNNEVIYSVNPEFSDIDFSALEYSNTSPELKESITEEYHFENVKDNVKGIYKTIKSELLSWDPETGFNPKKYYISIYNNRNIAFVITRKTKLRLVLRASPEVVRNSIKNYPINEFSTSVQKFWGGDSCELIIENATHLGEVILLLKKLLEQDKENN